MIGEVNHITGASAQPPEHTLDPVRTWRGARFMVKKKNFLSTPRIALHDHRADPPSECNNGARFWVAQEAALRDPGLAGQNTLIGS
jgi:hypothetical protein